MKPAQRPDRHVVAGPSVRHFSAGEYLQLRMVPGQRCAKKKAKLALSLA